MYEIHSHERKVHERSLQSCAMCDDDEDEMRGNDAFASI